MNLKISLKNCSLIEFFDHIKSNDLPQLEIINHVQFLTDDLKLNKLKILYADFNNYLKKEKEKYLMRYWLSYETSKKVIELNTKNIPIPYLKKGDKETLPYRIRVPQISNNYLDIEKLFFPDIFIHCYKFANLLNDHITNYSKHSFRNLMNQTNQVKSQNIGEEFFGQSNTRDRLINESFIYKINNNDRQINLSQLHDKLANAAPPFIKRPKDIRHFYKIFSGVKITHPIIWLGTNYELNYLIRKLNNSEVVEKNKKLFKTAIKCFHDRDNNAINYNSLRTANKEPNEKRRKLLDDLLLIL